MDPMSIWGWKTTQVIVRILWWIKMPFNVTQDDPVRSAKSWVVEGMEFFIGDFPGIFFSFEGWWKDEKTEIDFKNLCFFGVFVVRFVISKLMVGNMPACLGMPARAPSRHLGHWLVLGGQKAKFRCRYRWISIDITPNIWDIPWAGEHFANASQNPDC